LPTLISYSKTKLLTKSLSFDTIVTSVKVLP